MGWRMSTTDIPADAVARLHILNAPQLAGFPFAVIVARPPAEAVPEAVIRRGEVSGLLTHEKGTAWPDARGDALLRAVLREGGVAGLLFADLGDAMAAKRRLLDEIRRARAAG